MKKILFIPLLFLGVVYGQTAKKISAMDASTEAAESAVFPIVESGNNYKITKANFQKDLHRLADTLSASVLNVGVGNTGDSAIFESGVFLGGWRQYQDSVTFCRLDVKIWGESGDSIGITGYWNAYSADSTGSVSIIDFDIGTNGGTSYRTYYTTFDETTVGPGEIYFKIDAIHGNRPKLLRGTLGYTESR